MYEPNSLIKPLPLNKSIEEAIEDLYLGKIVDLSGKAIPVFKDCGPATRHELEVTHPKCLFVEDEQDFYDHPHSVPKNTNLEEEGILDWYYEMDDIV